MNVCECMCVYMCVNVCANVCANVCLRASQKITSGVITLGFINLIKRLFF